MTSSPAAPAAAPAAPSTPTTTTSQGSQPNNSTTTSQTAPSFEGAIRAQQEHLAQNKLNAENKASVKAEVPKEAEAKPEVKVEKSDSKDPWAKLDMLKTPDEVPAGEEGGVKPDDKTAKSREKFGEYKKAALEYQERKPLYEAMEKELQEFKSTWTPEKIARYEELAAFEAAKNIENTPEYKKQIIEPYAARQGELKAASEAFNVDFNALLEAANDGNRFNRMNEFRKLLKSAAEENGTEYDASIVAVLETTAAEMHALAEKADEHRREAVERWNAIEGKKTAETEASKQKAAQEYEKAHSEVFANLEKRDLLRDEFNFEHNGELLSIRDVVKNAKPADDAMGRAMQAQVAEMVPFLVTALNKVKAELAEVKKSTAARIAAKPTMNGTHAVQPTSDRPTMTLNEAIAAQQSRQGLRW